MPLDRKAAIVTGGAQGIGKAIARKFLTEGVAVVIADADAEAGRETEWEYEALGDLFFVHTDTSDETMVKQLIKEAVSRFCGIDILVNNAGIWMSKPLSDLSLAEWNRVLSGNLTSAFLCAKHAADFLKRNRGAIINIASTRAFMSEPDTEAYSASKGGMVALSHSLAISLGPDIRVNCISPGWIEVSEWKKKSRRRAPELSDDDHSQHPAGRVGKPEDIASLIMYLIGDEASFITGANFIVDGGMTRKMIYV